MWDRVLRWATPIAIGMIVPAAWTGLCFLLIPGPAGAWWSQVCLWTSMWGGILVALLMIQRVVAVIPIRLLVRAAILTGGILPALALTCGMIATAGAQAAAQANGERHERTFPQVLNEWESAIGLDQLPTGSYDRWGEGNFTERIDSPSGEPQFLFGGLLLPGKQTSLTFTRQLSPDTREFPALYWINIEDNQGPYSEDEIQMLIDQNTPDDWRAALIDEPLGSDPWTNPYNVPTLIVLQAFPVDVRQQVTVSMWPTEGTQQWVVTVDRPEAVHLTMPPGIKQMWVVAMPGSGQADHAGQPVLPDGLADPDEVGFRTVQYAMSHGKTLPEAEAIAAQEVQRFNKALVERPELNYFATYCQVGERQAKPLFWCQTFDEQDVGTNITLGLNAPLGVEPKNAARVIVGISTE